MRLIVLIFAAAVFVGCTTTPDPIDRLVADYSSFYGMWRNGLVPNLDLPPTASQEQVIKKALEVWGLTAEQLVKFKILKIRQVRIQGRLPDVYTAALVQTSVGEKIVLLQYENTVIGWWNRVVDANSPNLYKKAK